MQVTWDRYDAVHPRVRGSDAYGHDVPLEPVHPRVRGSDRTTLACPSASSFTVHPRVRRSDAPGLLSLASASVHPRVRGSDAWSVERNPPSVHPRVRRSDVCAWTGSLRPVHPRVRGSDVALREWCRGRFIRACAGATGALTDKTHELAVHPRVRGSDGSLRRRRHKWAGSSARARERPPVAARPAAGSTVHPRGRGSDCQRGTPVASVIGSSARARERPSPPRRPPRDPVHPRGRGSDARVDRREEALSAVHPRGRGSDSSKALGFVFPDTPKCLRTSSVGFRASTASGRSARWRRWDALDLSVERLRTIPSGRATVCLPSRSTSWDHTCTTSIKAAKRFALVRSSCAPLDGPHSAGRARTVSRRNGRAIRERCVRCHAVVLNR